MRTLTVNARLRFTPNDNRTNPHAPAFRVMIGRSHVGDAWERMMRTDPPRPMFRVVLDDPMFPAAVDAVLIVDEVGEDAVLLWQRPTPMRQEGGRAETDDDVVSADQPDEAGIPGTRMRGVASDVEHDTRPSDATSSPASRTVSYGGFNG